MQVDVRYSVRIVFFIYIHLILHYSTITILGLYCTTHQKAAVETKRNLKIIWDIKAIRKFTVLVLECPLLAFPFNDRGERKLSRSNYFWKARRNSTSLMNLDTTTVCTIGDTLLLLLDLHLHQAHKYVCKTEITLGRGLEDVGVHPPLCIIHHFSFILA